MAESVKDILLRGAMAAAGVRPLKGEKLPQPVTVLRKHLKEAVDDEAEVEELLRDRPGNENGESVSVCPVALVRALGGIPPETSVPLTVDPEPEPEKFDG